MLMIRREVGGGEYVSADDYADKLDTIEALTREVEGLRAYVKKMDGIIEEVGGVTASCINPYEDLKRAMIGQKERAQAAEARALAAEAKLTEHWQEGDLNRTCTDPRCRLPGVHQRKSCADSAAISAKRGEGEA
jgi:hypothetical protein